MYVDECGDGGRRGPRPRSDSGGDHRELRLHGLVAELQFDSVRRRDDPIHALAERVRADKALEIGLVEEVVPTGTSLERAMELAEQVGEQSPISVAACKRLIHSATDITIARGLEAERVEFVELFSSEDQREGVNAFLQKRKPVWKNR